MSTIVTKYESGRIDGISLLRNTMGNNDKTFLIEQRSAEQIVVRHERVRFAKTYCELCGHISEMLMLDAAVSVSGAATREILALIDDNRVHSGETPNGHLLVCRESLEAVLRSRTGPAAG